MVNLRDKANKLARISKSNDWELFRQLRNKVIVERPREIILNLD